MLIKIKIIKRPKIINSFLKFLLNISLLKAKFVTPNNKTTELNILVCGIKKLDKYEINRSKNIPYIPIKPMFSDLELKKNLLKKTPYPIIENIINQ